MNSEALATPINTDIADISALDGMSNDEYHKPEYGVSTTTIKNFLKDPSLIVWNRDAKQDESKMDAINFGTDFHSYFLESESFEKIYKVLPVFNRRVKAEKEAEQAMIAEWEANNITPVKAEDMEKLKAMRDSALAHPTVAAIMNLNGVAERSFFWNDPKTGIACKCRPDYLVEGLTAETRPPFVPNDCDTLVMDIKTIAQIDQIQNQIERLKYYLQDAFYTRGIQEVTGTKVCFVFAFVSTSLSMGRYPVQVVMLSDTARFDGNTEIDKALAGYAQLKANETRRSWQTVQIMDRPSWATREEDIY